MTEITEERFEQTVRILRKKIASRGTKLQHKTEVLAGDRTLTVVSKNVQFLDANGAGRDVILPAEANSENLFFHIFNTAAGAFSLTVKDDGAVVVVTIGQNEGAFLFCNGTIWRGLVGGIA